MEYILAPFARLQGVTKRKMLTRFSEQAWLLVYYSVFWTLGMVCRFFFLPCKTPWRRHSPAGGQHHE